MPWARLDDQFPDNRKIIRLRAKRERGAAAIGLWTMCLAWAHAHTRDKPLPEQGLLPEELPDLYVGETGCDLAKLLVEVGLWESTTDGWRIHDFREWCALEAREAQVAAGRRGARKRWHGDEATLFDDLSDGDPIGDPNRDPSRDPNGVGYSTHPNPTPTPTQPERSKSSSGDADFAAFWLAYPRREAKQAALRRWQAVVRTTDPSVIIEGAARYAELVEADRRDRRYVKLPSTWLNGGCWEDEIQEPGSQERQARVW